MAKRVARAPKTDQMPSTSSRREACLKAVDDGTALIFIEGHDDAILGVSERDGEAFVVYCQASIIDKLRSADGMGKRGAVEFFHYNIAGAYVGQGSPLFLERLA